MINAYKIVVETSKERDDFGDLDIGERISGH
jgi:hypothetical protein